MTVTAPNDFRHPTEIFTAEYTKAGDGWPTGHVQVFYNPPEGERELVFEYDRNYSMMRTFHPFRRWEEDRDQWHYYAFISTRYTTFQVLDLEMAPVNKVGIIAERPYPQRPWYRREQPPYDEYEKAKADHPDWFEEGGYYAGKGPDDLINAEGFCPVDFYVPDPAEYFDSAENMNEYLTGTDRWDERMRNLMRESALEWVNTPAWYSGCHWGDDSSDKLRTIDLSKLREGVVTDAEPYGYFEVWGKLKDAIDFGGDFLRIAAEMHVSLRDGTVYDPGINWRKGD